MTGRKHILTVSLEDYFQVLTFRNLVSREQWRFFETHLEQNTLQTLDLLDRTSDKATFFVLGWIAGRYPDLVREVARRGHEVANKGYYLRSFREMVPDDLRDNMARSREALERACGQPVIGCRVPQQWFTHEDLWALDVLADEGYLYDSSMVPMFWSFRKEPWRRFVHQHRRGDKVLWEFPISTDQWCGFKIPIAGGNYIRQFPRWWIRYAIRRWDAAQEAPFVMYFHVWELDPSQTKITAASPLARIRHYRNLARMRGILEEHLTRHRFTSIRDYLADQGVPCPFVTLSREEARSRAPEASVPAAAERTPLARPAVTLVLPCFNEEIVLPYLARNLESLEAAFSPAYTLSFVFVDDHSVDQTPTQLRALFGDRPNCKIVRHPRNMGVAAAIMTGIRCAASEIVCSIDCDCSYDPIGLREMIPLLTEDVDMVTASPYHPSGVVENVPRWRLGLSRVASRLYGLVLRQGLHTYTSCFRVYRRSKVADLPLREGGFIGVAELLGRLDLAGGKVVEYPTTLRVRLIGRSKMKILRAILGHLTLVVRLLMLRFRLRRQTGGRTASRAAPDGRKAPAMITEE